MSIISKKETINRLENFFLSERLTSASADTRTMRLAMFCLTFSRLSANEAMAEAAKTAILNRSRQIAQGLSLIIQGIIVGWTTCGQEQQSLYLDRTSGTNNKIHYFSMT
ncbi:MAG: hypothetical protein JNN20_05780 [Betaproteobacteria bacterium]|nr:hypothetical protein [Betaproteobacteria bacterium]